MKCASQVPRKKTTCEPCKEIQSPLGSDPIVHCSGTSKCPTTRGCHYCLARMHIGPDLKNWRREESSGNMTHCVFDCPRYIKKWPSITTLAANHAQPTVSDSQNRSCRGITHPLRVSQSKTRQKRNLWAVGPDVIQIQLQSQTTSVRRLPNQLRTRI